MINVTAGSTNYTTLRFVPTQLGAYEVFVWVNPSRNPSEYSYSNNIASRQISVELTVDESDLIVNGESTFTFTGAAFTHRGKIVVEDNGTLVITSASLNIDQNSENEFGIYVSDNGRIVMSQASLNSNHQIWLYLMDNGRLSMDNSTLFAAVSVSLDDQAQVFAWGSTISYRLIAPITSSGVVYAYNTTLSTGLTEFGGNARGYFTSVTIPSIRPLNNAVVWNYHWIDVYVVDGNNMKLPNATVNLVRYDIGFPLYASKMTDATGHALFQALSEIINFTTHSPAFLGNYRLNATYLFDGESYNTLTDTSVSLAPYSEPMIRNDPQVTLSIPGALPDLDPPLWASNSQPLRGSNVTLSTNITNSGVVNAYNVLVRFRDETSTVPWSKDVIIHAIEPGETVYLQVIWVASYPLSDHTLSVMLDPENTMREMDKGNNYNSTVVSVMGVAVLSVSGGDVTVSPASPTTNGSVVIDAVIHNSGDITANQVNISFMDRLPSGQTVLIGYNVIPSILMGSTELTSIDWVPTRPGTHTLTVTIKWGIPNQSISSNNETIVVLVKNYADLTPSAISFRSGTPVYVGQSVIIDVNVNNVGETTATDIKVSFWLGSVGSGTFLGQTSVAQIAAGQASVASMTWTVLPATGERVQVRSISVEVNPGHPIPEVRYDNNIRVQSVNVVDNRPDLKFTGGIEVTTANVSVDEAVIGQTIRIRVNVTNEGWTPAMGVVVLFSFVDSDNFTVNVGTEAFNFNPNQTRMIDLTYAVGALGVTIGNYTIKVTADSDVGINETNELNNFITRSFVVNAPNPSIDTAISSYEVKPDTDIVISGEVTNSLTQSKLSGVQVIVAIINSEGVRMSDNLTTTTSSQGTFSRTVHVPADLVKGTYMIKVIVIVPGGSPVVKNSPQFQVLPLSPDDLGISLWIWILIIVLVLVSILIGSWLIYRGLGRMVECGECGSLIPEASKRCPKCGVEFESGTAKCSQCGAWIPAASKECPECGAKFATEPMVEEENEYIKKMRGEYDEFVSPYREQAKGALGKKYSEAKFAEWWKKQPSYVTFERWLSQEEEKRKVAGTAFPCPVCGTLNVKGSAICHKCGTVFDALKGTEGGPGGAVKEGDQKPLRRIVRRPAEKKLIPKKEGKPEEGVPPEQPSEGNPEEPKSP
jgi:subtilase family serine protease